MRSTPRRRATLRALACAGVDRRHELATWNAVLWPVEGDRPSGPDKTEGDRALVELLELLPNVRAVVLLGDAAAAVWGRACRGERRTRGNTLEEFCGLHPGPRVTHHTAQEKHAQAVKALEQARRAAGLEPAGAAAAAPPLDAQAPRLRPLWSVHLG